MHTGSGDLVGGLLDCEGVVEGNHVPCRRSLQGRRRARRGLYAEKVCVRFKFRDGRRVRLVKLVDVVRRNGQRGL